MVEVLLIQSQITSKTYLCGETIKENQ